MKEMIMPKKWYPKISLIQNQAIRSCYFERITDFNYLKNSHPGFKFITDLNFLKILRFSFKFNTYKPTRV
jgi:hypothetical protein